MGPRTVLEVTDSPIKKPCAAKICDVTPAPSDEGLPIVDSAVAIQAIMSVKEAALLSADSNASPSSNAASSPSTSSHVAASEGCNNLSDSSETRVSSATDSPATSVSPRETGLPKEKASSLVRKAQDTDIEDIYEDNGLSTKLLQWKALIEDETMCWQVDKRLTRLPSHTRNVALSFLWSLCCNTGIHSSFAEAISLLDAFSARAPEKVQTSLAATCMAIVQALLSFDGVPLLVHKCVDAPLVAALSSAGHKCEINEHTASEIKSLEICLLTTMRGHIKLPSLLWWVEAYAKRLELRIRSELETSLAWARAKSFHCANPIVLSRSLVGYTAPRHIAAGLLAVNVACAGLVAFHDLCPEGVDIVQWRTMLLQSRCADNLPVCILSQEFAEGMLDELQEVCSCCLEDLQVGAAVALEYMCVEATSEYVSTTPASRTYQV
eukprot:TRINITY_DN6533_c0_g1_i1.p1 TRINITY_DN6533_c0_g1~~TRINITY_DN6533_c0_g1_i1.p1  ORF type:complete len:455 (-),score=56.88 TRINITY_DN6533_c0_g1_i1:361-1671(-)